MELPTSRRQGRTARSKEPRRSGGPEKAKTRSEDLLHRLESEILSGTIPPGTRLEEKILATRFSISRTPVREVLRHLASSGLVQMRPHQGAVVRQFTMPDLLEMFEVLAELEGLSARLAARRISPQEKDLLRTSHEACAAAANAGDEEAFFAENNVFHGIILNAGRNKFLTSELRDLYNVLNPYRRYITQYPGRMEKSLREHEEILDAIVRGNAAAAGDHMRSHLSMLGEDAGDFIAALSGMGPAGPFGPAAISLHDSEPPENKRRRQKTPG